MAEPGINERELAKTSQDGDHEQLYVVGIGASAGGLEALKTLFAPMPLRSGIAFVVVLHLSPAHESHIVELLQPYTRLRVRQVEQTTALEPDHIYVIPPNANLSAIDSHLRLSELGRRPADRAPIDHFLRTLATAHDGHAIGVILTGGGSDGVLGLRQIKEHGGVTIVQNPAEAVDDAMPRNAIATGTVDLVLPLHDMAEQILGFCATEPRLPVLSSRGDVDDESRALLDDILARAQTTTDPELSVYTTTLLLRRIRRRMKLRHVASPTEYLDLLHELNEARALANDLMLSVADFFGSKGLYERLEKSVIPLLFAAKPRAEDQVRVWAIGCATGEEAYSLAMLMLEERARHAAHPRVQLFASGMSEDTLQRARAGVYPHEISESVSAERLRRFFEEINGNHHVRWTLRDSIVFAAHDLYRDPPFTHVDLIVCRIALDELEPDVRRRVLTLFRYALEPHGVLVVPSGEPIDEHLFMLEHEEEGARIFRAATGVPVDASARPPHPALHGAALRPEDIHAQMIARHFPASVLVDDQDEVIFYSPSASRYLHLRGGVISHELTRLVEPALGAALCELTAAARRDRTCVSSAPLTFDTDHGPVNAVVRADPTGPETPPGVVLLVFDENAVSTETPAASHTSRIQHLETELERANERLRSLVAGEPTTPPDDVAGLRSELEAVRKQLQSASNELHVLDRENNARLHELAKVTSDLRMLLESMGIATLVLDPALRIVRFTPEMRSIFNVTETDRGRPLADLRHGLDYDALGTDTAEVLRLLTPIEREIEGADGRWFMSRLLPYRTTQHRVDGVVMTLIDVTARKRAEQELRDQDRRKDEFLALLAHELRNPLAPITTGIEVLKATKGEGAMAESMIAMMGRQAKQLVRLVDDLLDVSRVTGGRLRLRKTPIALQDIVRDALASVSPLVDKAQHQLVVQIADKPIVLDADAARLTQVLANLLNNAVRYTPKGGRIELRAMRDGGEVVIKVKDNGFGIAAPNLEHLFEMFYQGDDPRTARQSGLGIGLTLAKSLVEMHSGTISAESAGPDRGSEFTVRLPIPTSLPAAAAPAKQGTAPIAGCRVLIIDDNVDAAETLSLLIGTLGENEVRVESSGAAALATAAEFHPDVVFLDLQMPEMDGYEVARRLRAQPGGEKIRLVALTGFGLDEHKRRTRAAGFDQHLTKPADRASLTAVLTGRQSQPSSLPPSDQPTLH